MSGMTAEALLKGPRGRRLCLELLLHAAEGMTDERGWNATSVVVTAGRALEPDGGHRYASVILSSSADAPVVAPVEETARGTPTDAAAMLATIVLPARLDAGALRSALAVSVDVARYWQEPDGLDALLAQPELRTQLLRVAELVASSPAASWWSEPIDRWSQVTSAPDESWAPSRETAAEQLQRWAERRSAEERLAQRERPSDPTANWSGDWWSVPPSSLHRTTRALPGGPYGLDLVEDGFGWDAAEVRQVSTASGPVIEITGPEDWAALCRRWPFEVEASVRHDWYRVTGEERAWVLPDWSRVAHEAAGVHLTVLGYLRTATRLIELDGSSASVLAGWNPDATYWLRDGTREIFDPVRWSRPAHGENWTAESP